MDVVLRQAVEKLGAEGAIVKVKPGYARNYLLPRGLAVAATPQHVNAIERVRRQREQKAQRVKGEAESLKRRLEGRSLTLKLSLGEENKSFGAITTHDIVEALRAEGMTIDKHDVQLPQPIKALGIYTVDVKLHAGVVGKVKVWVVRE